MLETNEISLLLDHSAVLLFCITQDSIFFITQSIIIFAFNYNEGNSFEFWLNQFYACISQQITLRHLSSNRWWLLIMYIEVKLEEVFLVDGSGGVSVVM